MAARRVRTPHYIGGGFGDGHAKGPTDNNGNKDPIPIYLRQRAGRGRSGGAARGDEVDQERLAAQEHPALGANRWGLHFEELSSSGDEVLLNPHRLSSPPDELGTDSWQFSAFAALLGVILMSAIFLHIILDAHSKSNYRSSSKKNAYFSRHNYSSNHSTKKTRKEKDVEGSDDDADLLDEDRTNGSVTPSASADGGTAPGNATGVPKYFPSTQPGLQQRRKPAGGASSQASPFQHNPYYLNPSGGAVIPQYRSPSSTRVLRIALSQSETTDDPPPIATALTPVPPAQRKTLNPQLLSPASSFESSKTDFDRSTIRFDTNLSPQHSPAIVDLTPSRKSHLLLSPGTDDFPLATPKVRNGRLTLQVDPTRPDADQLMPPEFPTKKRPYSIERTHEAGNLRPAFHGGPQDRTFDDLGHLPFQGFQNPGEEPLDPWPALYETVSVSSETYGFASPPSPRTTHPPPIVPFMPNLDVHVAPVPQPHSLNVDELHLAMESGNVPLWRVRVPEGSQQMHNPVSSAAFWPPPSSSSFESGSADEDTTSNSEIPSNRHVRGSIRHVRANLINSTNASASLQGAIAFSELNLVDVIGGGGFGQVWKAVWNTNGTPVAVKVLSGSAQSKNVPKPVLEEFLAEINLLKGMRHPNICLYMGACLDPPHRAIITELAANGSLWDALRLPLMPPYVLYNGVSRDSWPLCLYIPDARHGAPPSAPSLLSSSSSSLQSPASSRFSHPMPPRGSWPWCLVKRVACGAARGMAYLHNGRPPVLHRDLKSANILLDESYTPKICDFGLSRLKSQGRSNMTANVGTVQWMAPEVLANSTYNEKADVYSFGIICWELLTRQCPYDGMDAIECALSVLNSDRRPEIPKWCPPSLHALIRACLKRNPDERPTFLQITQAFDSMP